jgi:hypothetical protein
MQLSTLHQHRTLFLAALAFVSSCGGDEGTAGPSPCVAGQYCPGSLVCVDGFCVDSIGSTDQADGVEEGVTMGSTAADTAADTTDGGTTEAMEAVCGDGIVQAGEACDGPDPGTTCVALGYVSGELACGTDCQFDISGCETCGNGQVDGDEDCDGQSLGGHNCTYVGYNQGTLLCNPDCTFNTEECCWTEGFGCFDSPGLGGCCEGLSCLQFGCQ